MTNSLQGDFGHIHAFAAGFGGCWMVVGKARADFDEPGAGA
jgi:hypothetical protein